MCTACPVPIMQVLCADVMGLCVWDADKIATNLLYKRRMTVDYMYVHMYIQPVEPQVKGALNKGHPV